MGHGEKKKRRYSKPVSRKLIDGKDRSDAKKRFSTTSTSDNRNGFIVDEETTPTSTSNVIWRKILYEKQPFPDNYCSPKFLEGLKTNVTARRYTFEEAVRGSLILMHQVNSVVLYVISFAFVRSGWLDCRILLIFCFTIALTGYCVYAILMVFRKRHDGSSISPYSIRQTLKTLALYIGFGYGLSPIFKTLTETISTDTIYALSTFMFVLNIVFADYGVDVAVISSALSLNAAIFGTVCLISRLQSSNEVFSLLTLAVEMFVLWPLLRWNILAHNSASNTCIALISALTVIAGLRQLSLSLTILYIFWHIFVSLACPWGLMKMQPLKSTIHGPWDEAIVVT